MIEFDKKCPNCGKKKLKVTTNTRKNYTHGRKGNRVIERPIRVKKVCSYVKKRKDLKTGREVIIEECNYKSNVNLVRK